MPGTLILEVVVNVRAIPGIFVFLDCGSNISNTDSGKVQSPNFPLKYTAPEKGMPSRTCNWFINVRPNYKILLNFVSFSVEGDPLSTSARSRPILLLSRRLTATCFAVRGCPAAVVRLWPSIDEPPLELCGKKPDGPWQFLSDSNQFRIRCARGTIRPGRIYFRARESR